MIAVSCNGNPEIEKKIIEKHILSLFLQREIAGTLFFASVLPTRCLSIRAEKVALKQFQLRDIVMRRFTPAGRLALCYPSSILMNIPILDK